MDNYIKIEAGGARIQDLLCDRQNVTELSGDFSLPDYQPEIKRLLRVKVTVSPPDKYIGAGNADFSGMIDYCILYAGNDGALYCANESQEYQFSVPLEGSSDFDLGDGLVCDADRMGGVITLTEGKYHQIKSGRRCALGDPARQHRRWRRGHRNLLLRNHRSQGAVRF